MYGFVRLLWLYFMYLVLSVEKCFLFSFFWLCLSIFVKDGKKRVPELNI